MKLKVAAYCKCDPDDVELVKPGLIRKVRTFKGYEVVGITTREGWDADGFMRNKFTVIAQGWAYYRKPRFIRPNYNRYVKREGNKKYRKLLLNYLRQL